jgi:hypothetical protein
MIFMLTLKPLHPHTEVSFVADKSLEVWEKRISPTLRGFSLCEKTPQGEVSAVRWSK